MKRRLLHRLRNDRRAAWLFGALTVMVCLMILPLGGSLLFKSGAVLREQSLLSIITSTDWQPQRGCFGMKAFLVGTFYVSALAMVLAVPISLLTAIYLAEYAPRRLTRLLLPVIDLLSGIPSVIYGVWGILAIVPLAAALAKKCGYWSSGYSLLAGSIVLAVMVCPYIIHLSREVIAAVPDSIREASLALGATRWQTIRKAVLRHAFPGITAAVIMGLSRAFGETIAVLMVVGNVPLIPKNVFDPAYPLPALLANNYGEMMSIPLYDSALMFAAFLLLLIVVAFNLLAKAMLHFLYREHAV